MTGQTAHTFPSSSTDWALIGQEPFLAALQLSWCQSHFCFIYTATGFERRARFPRTISWLSKLITMSIRIRATFAFCAFLMLVIRYPALFLEGGWICFYVKVFLFLPCRLRCPGLSHYQTTHLSIMIIGILIVICILHVIFISYSFFSINHHDWQQRIVHLIHACPPSSLQQNNNKLTKPLQN